MYILTVNMYIIHNLLIIGHNKEETSADVPPEQSFAPSIIRHNIEIGPSPQIELEIKMANAGQTDLVSLIYIKDSFRVGFHFLIILLKTQNDRNRKK